MGRPSNKQIAEMTIEELEKKIRTSCAKNVNVDPEVCKDCKGCAYGCNLVEKLKEDYSYLRFDKEAVARKTWEMEKSGESREAILTYLKKYYTSPDSALLYIQSKSYPDFEKEEAKRAKKAQTDALEKDEKKPEKVVVEKPEKTTPKPVDNSPKKSKFSKFVTLKGEFANYVSDSDIVKVIIGEITLKLTREQMVGLGNELIEAVNEI